MSTEKKPHKCPVGTIREWEKGQVIKAHDNSIFDTGWMLTPNIPDYITNIFNKLDSLGKDIIRFKEPVDGTTWLEKVINEWESPSGEKYSLAQFKQYFGFFGSAQYSFKNEFSRRYMSDKIELHSEVNKALLRANESAEDNVDPSDRRKDKVYLTKEEIKDIKARVRSTFKYMGASLDMDDPKNLSGKLENVLKYLQQAENLEGEDKEIYDRNKKIIDELPFTYIPLKEMKQKVSGAIAEINAHFKDNWGITKSFKNKAIEQKAKFINNFADRIKAEELGNFQKELGCDLFEKDVDKFYSAVKSLGNRFASAVNLKDYVGKHVPDYRKNSYQDFILKEVTDRGITLINEQGRLESLSYTYYADDIKKLTTKIALEDIAELSIPLELRFQKIYHKELGGDWDFDSLDILQNTEKVLNYLPKSHGINNDSFKKLEKTSSIDNGHGAYACFVGNKSKIFLSNDFLNISSKFTDVNDGNHFSSVMIHEIGHAVSHQLKRQDNLDYKRFGVQCGWSWTDLKYAGISTFATGQMKDVVRTGSKSGDKLITKYAHKSPEEAFAEYYSFYQQHKHTISKYLETGNVELLKKQKAIDTHTLKLSDTTVGDYFESNLEHRIKLAMDAVLYSHNIDIEDHKHMNVSLAEAFKIKPTMEHNIDPEFLKLTLRNQKASSIVMPIMAIKNVDGSLSPMDEKNAYLAKANFYLKRKVPTLEISQEAHSNLIRNGFSSNQIEHMLIDHLHERNIPEVFQDGSNKHGLKYDGEVIDYKILEKNKDIFKAMKHLIETEDFKKAMEDIFNVKDIESKINDADELIILEKSEISKRSLFDIFKSCLVEPFLSNKKQNYSDIILINEEGKFLILLRSNSDDFCPGKWTLPGGKIESNETPIEAAARELEEETNIRIDTSDLECVKQIEKETCKINYFVASVYSSDVEMYLDTEEHQGYEWISESEIKDKDFLLDLKDTLNDFFNLTQEAQRENASSDFEIISKGEMIYRSIDTLNTSFDKGEIDDDTYLQYKEKLNVIKSDYDSLFETRTDDNGNEFKIKLIKSQIGDIVVKDSHILGSIMADRQIDFQHRLTDFLSQVNHLESFYEAFNLRKGEKEVESENPEGAELQDEFGNYLSDSFYYKDKLYDRDGFMIPLPEDLLKQVLSEYSAIYKVPEDRINPQFESDKPILDSLDRKRFERVLPMIEEFENMYNDLLAEAQDKFMTEQVDYITRSKDIKKVIKYVLSKGANTDQVYKLLEYIKQSLSENIDPLLEIRQSSEQDKPEQIYLSEFMDLLNSQDSSEDNLGVHEIIVVDLDKLVESDFHIDYFDPNDSVLIQTICNQVKEKLQKKQVQLLDLSKSFDNNEITEDEFISQLLKGRENKFMSDSNDIENETKLTVEQIKKWARETSLEVLESTIKTSSNESMRKAAHDEMARREKHEHPQEPKKPAAKKKAAKKK